LRGRDYAGKYDASYEDVAELIKSHSSRPLIDLGRIFRRLIVFALIGNCDAHLKNFSLLETPTGLRLSPAYDVVNTALHDHYERSRYPSVGGKCSWTQQPERHSRSLAEVLVCRPGRSRRRLSI
jgi:serine/threonine-protein kinase HipA